MSNPHESSEIDSQSAEAFLRKYGKSQTQILGFVLTLIPSLQEAEEVLQETSVILWKKWPQFDPSREFLPWACGIARFEVFRHLRSKPKGLHLSQEVLNQIADLATEQSSSDSQQIDAIDALKACVNELPSKDVSLLGMRYQRDIAVVDIAAEMGLAKSTVFDLLRQIRLRLQRCVQRRLRLAEEVQ